MTEGERLLTTSQAALILHVSDETVRRWAEEKRIRHLRLPSGQLRFRPADLAEVLTPVEPKAAS
jgi:excisionase family DNA binding protein